MFTWRTHTCEDFCSQHCSSHSCSLFLCPITMVVENHLKWGAPSVLILLTLLVRWNQQIPHTIDPHLEEKSMVFFLLEDRSFHIVSFFKVYSIVSQCFHRDWSPPTHTHTCMALGTSKERDFVEVFSGRGEISRALRDVTWWADFEHMLAILLSPKKMKWLLSKTQSTI